MALDFPATPSNGQQFTSGGTIWTWDGAKWVAGATTSAFAPIASPVFTGNPTAPTAPVGDADTSLATTAFVAASTATALTNVGRNLIHNSMFNIAQRGAGPWTTNMFMLDRWMINPAGGDAASFQQAVLIDAQRAQIGDEAAAFSLYNTVTGSAAAGAFTTASQAIEGVRRLAGKTVTLSFWAAATAGLKLGCSFYQVFGTGGSPSALVTVNGQSVTLTASFARYSLTFTLPSISGKTLGTNGNDSTQLYLWYSSGATNNTTAGSIGVQSGTFQLWGVQLEIGSVATPLEKLDPVTQLQQCQRFYQFGQVVLGGYSASAVTAYATVTLPVQMRGPLTIAISANNDGALTGPTQSPLGYSAILFQGTTPAGATGWNINRNYTVSADL